MIRRIVRKRYRSIISKMVQFMVILLLTSVLSLTTESFFTFSNLTNILRQMSINCLISAGVLLVMLTGGIDLSVGAVLSVSTCTMAGCMVYLNINNPFLLIIIGLLVGLFFGMLNGLLLTKLKIPHPFIATMATSQIARGLALLITGAEPITGFPRGVSYIGFERVYDIPICFIVVIIVFIIYGIFLKKTALGKRLYAIGGNKKAALLSGININAVLIFSYCMSGLMASFAGIVFIGRIGSATPLAGDGFEMDAIAACVIGGVSLNGGKGKIGGILMGAVLVAVLRNGLNLVGAESDIQYIVTGVVIILAVFIDVLRNNTKEKEWEMQRIKMQGTRSI